VNVVLERDRDAVQRTPHATQPTLAVAFVGLLERARVHVDGRVQTILVESDPHQRLGDNVS
jgi:hypothetical protein